MFQQTIEENDRTVLRNHKRNIRADIFCQPVELLDAEEEDNLVRTIQLSKQQRIQIIAKHEGSNDLQRLDDQVENDPVREMPQQGGQEKSMSAFKHANEDKSLWQSIENINCIRNHQAIPGDNQTNNENEKQSKKKILQNSLQDAPIIKNHEYKSSNSLPENFQLEVIRDGRFNLGGVRLEIDFQKKLVKAVKQVKFQDHFEREVHMLKTLSDEDVSLKLLDVDYENLTFVQRGGFISLKRVSKIIEFKNLQTKYRVPFEFFLLKQLDFLLEKLNILNNVYQIAHGDIKPNNIVLGFDFVSYFIDFGGAIFFQEESDQYLNLCTPTFILPEFLRKESFSEKDIKRCEKTSLFLTFLFLLCRDKEENAMFFAREYSKLMIQLRNFYSNDLIDAFEGYLLGGIPETDIEKVIENLVAQRIVSQMEELEESEMFLRELKQFDYQNGVYIVKEWDQFNTNVLKLFPELQFEVDLMEISEKKQLFRFLQDNRDKQLFVNTSKVFYSNLVNCFVAVGSDCRSLRLQHLNANDAFRICDLLEYNQHSMRLRVDFTLSRSQQNYLKFEGLQKLAKLEILGSGMDIQSQFLAGFTGNSKIDEFKLKCGDVNISKFQELLISQTNLKSLHVRISSFQYNIELPKLSNQLRKLKCNCQISNIQQVIADNKDSLEVLELVLSEGQNGLNEVLSSILVLSKLTKLSLKVQYLKLTNQQQSQAKSSPVLSEEFYSFLYCCFSEKQISEIKLNFGECNLNAFDAVQLARVIKATQLQFPRILKLKIVQPAKPIDDKSTQVILGAVFQSKLIRSKISLTNKPATIVQSNPIAGIPLKQAETQSLGLMTKEFKSANIQQISLNLNYFPPRVLQLLSIVPKVKLLFASSLIPPQFLKINSLSQDAMQSEVLLQKDQQQVVLKPTNLSLNDAFSQIIPQSAHITIRLKQNKKDSFYGTSANSASKSNQNLRNLQDSMRKPNEATSLIARKVEDYVDFQFDCFFGSKSIKISNIFKQSQDQHNNNNNLCALATSLSSVNSSLRSIELNCNVGSLPRYFSHTFLKVFLENLTKNKSIETLKLSVPFGFKFDSKSDSLSGLKEFITTNTLLRQFDLELKGCSLGVQSIMRLKEAFQDMKLLHKMSLTVSLIDCQDVDQSMIVELISQLNQSNVQVTLLVNCLSDYDTFLLSIMPSYEHCSQIKFSTNSNENGNNEFFKEFVIFPQDLSRITSSVSVNSKLLILSNDMQTAHSTRAQNHFRAFTENRSPHALKPEKSTSQLIYNHQIAQVKTLYPQSFQSLSPQLSSDKSPTVFSQTSKSSKFSLESNKQLTMPPPMRSLSSQRKLRSNFIPPSGFASLPNKINFPQNHLKNNLPCILQYQSNTLTLITETSSKIPSLECILNPKTNLKNLEISFSQQSLDIREFLTSMRKHICLETLSLTFGFQIPKQEIELLSEAIMSQPKLVRLNLNLNHAKLHSVNLKCILESIATFQTLEQLFLDISFNAIQPKGAKYLEALADIPNLSDIHINISNNFLGLEGVSGISKFISKMQSTVINLSLGLDFNFIGENALSILRTAVESKKTLQVFSVSLRGNQIRQEEAARFQASLSSHASICTYSVIADPSYACDSRQQ